MILVWALLVVAAAYAVYRLFLGYPRPAGRYRWVRRREAAFLRAAAEALFPADASFPLSGAGADLPGYVERYYGVLQARQRRQIRLLLLFFEQATFFFPAPAPRGRRRFSALDREQQTAVLRAWSESDFFLRRFVFTALRAVLGMGFLGHPSALRHLRLAPYDIESPICEADLLYPPVGVHPRDHALSRADLTAPSDGSPIDLDGPLHPEFRESAG